MTRTALRLALAAVLLAFPGACAGVLTGPPAKLYTLTPGERFDPALPQAAFHLLVETPVAGAGLDTQRIAVRRNDTAIDYIAEAAWADRAPALLQGLLVQSFEDSRRIVSVGRDTAGLRSDLVLRTELRDFQAEYSSPGAAMPDRVHIRIAAKLVSMPRRTIVAGERFEAVVPVGSGEVGDVGMQGGGVQGIVTAFDTALAAVLEPMVAWTLRTGNGIASAAPPR